MSYTITAGMWPTTVWNPSASKTVRRRSTVSLLELNTAMIGRRGPGSGSDSGLPSLGDPASMMPRPFGSVGEWPTPSLPREPREAGHDGRELRGIHRLGHVHVESGHEAPDPVRRAIERGQREGRRAPSLLRRERAHRAHERVAVVARHLD